MKKLFKGVLLSAVVALTAGSFSANATSGLDKLLEQVKNNRVSQAKIDKQREAQFTAARADKQAILNKAKTDLANEKARGKRLQKQFSDNEVTLANKEVELENATGTLGEMFGVTRQNAADAYGAISSSIVSSQYPGRGELLAKLSEAKEIPTLEELEELWIALQTEITESAKIVRFDTEVTDLSGGTSVESVIRVGSFNLIGKDGYLRFNPETNQIQPLGRQPEGHIVSSATSFMGENSGLQPLFIDPSQGTILGLLVSASTLEERFHQGGDVGYVITVMLILGLLIALERILVLTTVGAKIKSQLKDTSVAKDNNPLGRILKVYHDNRDADIENLELKLDEAVMRELPRIERGISIIKIFAAIAPLLGLLGTVIGMIGTFQSITLFGTGDPKIMAGSISMALVTTAMGLIAALPLIIAHSFANGKSKAIVHILDEQSAGIVAAHAEREHN